MSVFAKWFREQFGEPPKRDILSVMKDLEDLQEQVVPLERELAECRYHVTQKRAARLAWTAKEDGYK